MSARGGIDINYPLLEEVPGDHSLMEEEKSPGWSFLSHIPKSEMSYTDWDSHSSSPPHPIHPLCSKVIPFFRFLSDREVHQTEGKILRDDVMWNSGALRPCRHLALVNPFVSPLGSCSRAFWTLASIIPLVFGSLKIHVTPQLCHVFSHFIVSVRWVLFFYVLFLYLILLLTPTHFSVYKSFLFRSLLFLRQATLDIPTLCSDT